MDNKKIWKAVLGELEVALSKAHFTTWFKNSFILSNENGIIIIGVPNFFTQEWLKNKYHGQITTSLKKFIPELKNIEYKVSTQTEPTIKVLDKNTVVVEEQNEQSSQNSSSEFNLNYTFSKYVVGSSNRLAYATSLAVGDKPGKKYNPLFIYGGVGLGKTHLIQAIGNEIKKKYPKKRIVYAPCEHFATEYINAIQNKTIEAFKKKYRKADLLLIDDIQFLSGKEGTQEEFFHTFNALYQTNKQIVLTSDRVPHAIPELADRLSSRFAGGMVTDIKPPDLETREAILKTKCEEKGYILDKEIIAFIAQKICSNIRELEGALNKIFTNIELYNIKPTQEMVARLLEDMITDTKRNLNPSKIFKIVASFFDIKIDDLLGPRRNKELVYPRQLTMYLLRHEVNYSFPRIGKELGGKDHTTIMHGVSKIEKEISKNEQIQRELSLIKEKLYL